eukprot:6205148-Pleurochrysis_carterae.AAC.1
MDWLQLALKRIPDIDPATPAGSHCIVLLQAALWTAYFGCCGRHTSTHLAAHDPAHFAGGPYGRVLDDLKLVYT